MARADAKTAVLADGLRYKSKVSGSPFAATTSFWAATMSCFMCGKHRARSLMGTRKVLGKSQAVWKLQRPLPQPPPLRRSEREKSLASRQNHS